MLQGRVVRTSSQFDDRGRDRELRLDGVEDVHVKSVVLIELSSEVSR